MRIRGPLLLNFKPFRITIERRAISCQAAVLLYCSVHFLPGIRTLHSFATVQITHRDHLHAQLVRLHTSFPARAINPKKRLVVGECTRLRKGVGRRDNVRGAALR